jgi:uncharacterized Tic20 family protein
MAFCSACQIEVSNAKFCTTCGRQLVEASVPGFDQTSAPVAAPVATSKSSLAMWAHLAPLIAAFVGFGITAFFLWLPGLLIRGSAKATEFDRRHATESLNFQLSLLIYSGAATLFTMVTFGIGFLIALPALIILIIAALVFIIMATVAASGGREYRYPLTIRFVK